MIISYNWLKWYVPQIPEAKKLADVFNDSLCEIESIEEKGDDFIFDLKVLPDRAHDLLSHHGVARELSGLLNIPFVDPTEMYKIPESVKTNLQINIENNLCRRYMGRILRGVKIGPSPDWVVKHLESIGQRSINNVVDATNIVMYDCGQPCHAFDVNKVSGHEIRIINASSAQKITILGGKEIELAESDLIISDKDKNALAIAGVKGGVYAEVTNETKDIILEVANFNPVSTRKTARRLAILTDSAKRFENDLTPENAQSAMRELSALILEMCPEAVFEDIVDVYPNPEPLRKINFSAEYISKKLGVEITKEIIKDILNRYKYKYEEVGDDFILDVPVNRIDIMGAHDMVEEIGRVFGYEKIIPQIPKINFSPKINKSFSTISTIRNFLIQEGFSEVYNYSFTEKGELEVLSPLSKDKGFLRTNLIDGLKESLEKNSKNASLLGLDVVKIFEVGNIFDKEGESISLSLGVKNIKKSKVKESEILDSMLAEISKLFNLEIKTKNKSENILEINLTEVIKNIPETFSFEKFLSLTHYPLQTTQFKAWSNFPFMTRDISGWVSNDQSIVDILSSIKNISGDLLVAEPRIVDRFEKDGRTSYAFRLIFQAYDRTLTDEEVNNIIENVTNELTSKYKFEVR